MRRLVICLVLPLLLSSLVKANPCTPTAANQVTLTASPNGVLDSLPKVLYCVANLVSKKPEIKTITVTFSPGIYRQTVSAVFSEKFSSWNGTLSLKGTFRKTLFSGAQIVESFEKVHKQPNKYVATVPVWVTSAIRDDLARDHGLRDATAPPWLIISGKPLELARFPNSGFMKISEYQEESENVIRFEPNTVPRTNSSVSIQGFLKFGWADSRRQVKSFNPDEGILQIAGPSIKYGIKKGGRFVLRGAPEFVDENGEFAVKADKKIYFQFGQMPESVEVSVANKILEAKSIKNLILDGLSFSGARSTAIDLAGENISIKNVEVLNAGWIGIRLKGNNNLIDTTLIANTGYSGVELTGGVRESLSPGNNRLINSTIQDFGSFVWSSVPGVRVEGVGNTISGNKITRGPHSGIFYFGNDHKISGNEVSFVARETDDVGAIYSGRDWAGRGHQVTDNYIHDVHGVGAHGATALYLDDQVSGILLSRNIIWNVDRGILIGGGRDNTVTENIVIKAKQCIRFDDRGLTWQKKEAQPGGSLWVSVTNIKSDRVPVFNKYKGLESTLIDKPGYPVGNVVQNNVLLCPSSIVEEAFNHSTVSRNWTKGNPGFNSIERLVQGQLPARMDFRIDWKNIDWPSETQ